MKCSWPGFHSLLADGIQAFLAHKRALGCLFRAEEMALRLLDRFLEQHRITAVADITPTVIDDFLVSRPRPAPRSYNHLRGTLVRFFDWMIQQQRLASSPVRAKPRHGTRVRLPFLLDPAAARRLFDVAGELPDTGGTTHRGSTYRTIFTLLYGLGLRVGEVARLRIGDIDTTRRVLHIRNTKFAKSRLVPFGPRIDALLVAHLERRAQQNRLLPAEMAVFSLRGGRPVRQHHQSDLSPARAETGPGHSRRRCRSAGPRPASRVCDAHAAALVRKRNRPSLPPVVARHLSWTRGPGIHAQRSPHFAI